MKTLNRKIYEELNKSVNLRSSMHDEKINFDKRDKILQQQEKAYNKYLFFKNLSKAIDKK